VTTESPCEHVGRDSEGQNLHKEQGDRQGRAKLEPFLFTTPMSSTYAYTALSPDYADLAQPTQDNAVQCIPSSSPSPVRTGKWTRVYEAFASLKSIYQRNVGLLLVTASQMFFSLMNVAVKKLNSIDPPVSALEVCYHRRLTLAHELIPVNS
jgi:hypothetical protein